jgi:uncharacterized cupin superfamily protein
MPDPNVFEPQWDMELADPPVRGRFMRLGPKTGAKELGASLYEIDPQGAVSPYHVQHGNEELLIVLSGTPRLRTPDGSRDLRAGDVVSFPRGPDGAHRISNHGTEPVRVLVFSTMNFPEIAEHVETGTILAVRGPRDGLTYPKGSERRFEEAWMEAMRVEAEAEGLT